ncbi:MAG: flagellar basal body P-ring formation chaperone FlgA [Planctomycetota bacterium]|nr:flagellar basal body P-ring formation chaperone FlgA [Planctomycetota bacterium]
MRLGLFRLAAALVLAWAAASAAGVEIRLAGERTVNGPQVRLGEIAEIDGADPALRERLSRLVVGSVPTLRPWRLEAAALRPALREYAAELRLVGAVTIQRARRAWGAEEIAQAVRRALPSDARVTMRLDDGETLLAPNDSRLEAETVADPWGSCLVRVRALADGREYARIVVGCLVERPVMVVVASRDLEPGTTLAADDLRGEQRFLTRPQPALQPEQLVGGVLRRRVRAGEILLASSVQAAPAVRAGNAVTALWQGQGFVLEIQALAVADARVGERVGVRRAGERTVLTGIVQADGRILLGP